MQSVQRTQRSFVTTNHVFVCRHTWLNELTNHSSNTALAAPDSRTLSVHLLIGLWLMFEVLCGVSGTAAPASLDQDLLLEISFAFRVLFTQVSGSYNVCFNKSCALKSTLQNIYMIKCSSIFNRDKMKRSFFNIFFNFSLVLFSLCTYVLLNEKY